MPGVAVATIGQLTVATGLPVKTVVSAGQILNTTRTLLTRVAWFGPGSLTVAMRWRVGTTLAGLTRLVVP